MWLGFFLYICTYDFCKPYQQEDRHWIKKMGKHKNRDQCDIFLRFMERRPDLAKGFAKGDRVCHDQEWEELAVDLNSAGPPIKDVSAWKKAWADWKLNIRRRLSHNKTELRKTGGGRFNQYVLSPVEEEVATLCGLYQAVDGIGKAKTFSARKVNLQRLDKRDIPTTSSAALSAVTNTAVNDAHDLPTTSSSVSISQMEAIMEVGGETSVLLSETLLPLSPPGRASPTAHVSPVSSTISVRPRTSRRRGTADVADFFEMERENFQKLTEKVANLKIEMTANRTVFSEVNSNIKNISEGINSMSQDLKEIRLLKEKKLEELKRHHHRMEQVAANNPN